MMEGAVKVDHKSKGKLALTEMLSITLGSSLLVVAAAELFGRSSVDQLLQLFSIISSGCRIFSFTEGSSDFVLKSGGRLR